MINAREFAGLVILTGAAFGSWYLSRPADDGEVTQTDLQALTQGYYLKQARIFGTADDGALVYEIRADEALQRGDRSVSFSNVNIRYATTSNVPWSVDADEAVIDPNEPRIRLTGHVTALSREGFGGVDTEIRTNYLELDPDRYLAETDERVQIRIGERSLTATGMRAALQENRLALLSNVSGKFTP